MDLQFGLAMVLGIGPALILMYVILRNYTYPRVEQPFFSDPAFFGLFMVGLVIGSVLFFALTAMRLGGGLIYMILLAIIEMMAMVVVMNLRRFRGKSDSVFYGYGLGLGMAAGMSTGFCYVLASSVESVDASIITMVIIAVSLTMIIGACATNVGEGVARHRVMEYTLQGMLLLVAFNMLFTVVLNAGVIGGELMYYVCQFAMLALSAVYFHRIMMVKLPGIVREVLKMEGKKRNDLGR